MKQTIFTLLLFCAIGLVSCRKDKVQPDIKTYDQQQILNYIKVNGLTGMVKDTVGGDTTGMYYQILTPGTGARLQYTNQLSLVFSVRTLDGSYQSLDTINNHFYDYLGHVVTDKLPLGLQSALINDAQFAGTRMRVLIPSHLAYGVDGYGSGSSQVANNRIGGNECLDYYVNVIGNQPAYDDQVIRSYMRDSSFTGYTKTTDGLYYKVITPATANDPITDNSTIAYAATGQLFNAVVFDNENGAAAATATAVDGLIQGIQEGLKGYASTGTKISLLIPSALGYGTTSQTSIPANSCLRFTFVISTVSP